MCKNNKEVWRYVMEHYPKLLRATRGSLLTAKARAENANVKRIFYRDEALRTEIPISHGNFNGVGTSYFKNGHVSLTLPYTDGKLNGISKSYFDDGNLLEETAYAAGERHGADRIYGDNNALLGTHWWWHGKIVSEDEFRRATATKVR